ncbi:Bridging integrator 3 [Saguinus oedipus]|uniref:Bridging integrator 3 n=1 Tax=Saguinus oedipus TaxID=9490 RepID=A0ABQ9UMU8_SAGOE|nr:Bridging integrator 3 [Saguinus oedipus]
MSKSAVKISLDLLFNPLCGQDQDLLNMVTALDTAVKRMDTFNQERRLPEPQHGREEAGTGLAGLQEAAAKVEKHEEKEKAGPVLDKLHQAPEELRPMWEDFEANNRQLLEEMLLFYGSRLDYFQPSFESLI